MRGTSRLSPSTTERVAGRGRSAARRRPAVVGVERAEALGVDAGRDDDGRAAPRPGGPLGLGRRVAAGGDHERGAAQHPAEQRGASPGSRPGTVTSAPCSDDAVGPLERRPEQPERQGRVEQHELGVDLGGQPVDPAPQRRAWAAAPRWRVRSTRNGCAGVPGRGAGVRAW